MILPTLNKEITSFRSQAIFSIRSQNFHSIFRFTRLLCITRLLCLRALALEIARAIGIARAIPIARAQSVRIRFGFGFDAVLIRFRLSSSDRVCLNNFDSSSNPEQSGLLEHLCLRFRMKFARTSLPLGVSERIFVSFQDGAKISATKRCCPPLHSNRFHFLNCFTALNFVFICVRLPSRLVRSWSASRGSRSQFHCGGRGRKLRAL